MRALGHSQIWRGEVGWPGVCTYCSRIALAFLPVLMGHSLGTPGGNRCCVSVLPVTLALPVLGRWVSLGLF